MMARRQSLSSWMESLSVQSPSFRYIRIPMSGMYVDDILRLCELFHGTFGKFKVEIDTDRQIRQFNQDNYLTIGDIDKSERAEAMILSYYGDSFYPVLFMILAPSMASILVNDKYRITYGFIDDVLAITGHHRRVLDAFYGVRPSSVAAIVLIFDVVALLALGFRGIYWTATLITSMALILAIVTKSLYSDRHYYRLSLHPEPPASPITRLLSHTGNISRDALEDLSVDNIAGILFFFIMALIVLLLAAGVYALWPVIFH